MDEPVAVGTVMVEPVAAIIAATRVAVPPKNDKLDHRNGFEHACAVPSLACKPTLYG